MLRAYQQRAIDQLYQWFEDGNTGNPCLVLPTGSGKSHIVAALCKDALQNWPETRILMLTHSKELIEQNSEKMRLHWKGAPLGIYSASIGRKQLDEPITFGGIQSLRNKALDIGHVDLIIVDESHLIGHKDEGGYRKLIKQLSLINPMIRIIGLTATPYRLGHGLITEKPAIFDALIEPTSIEELIYHNYLAPLRSKVTKLKLSTEGVHKRGGDFIESELQKVVDTDDNNERIAREIIEIAGDRKSWLLFCSGVKHADRMAAVLTCYGIASKCVTGDTSKVERERILSDFKSGTIRAVTNANVLTTGFDYPDIDLIAMLRPTLSPGLYVQMAGRGMRIKSHTDHCLVLDFAGVVATHGPITCVQPPKKGSSGEGDAPVKLCEQCFEICAVSARVCPACGFKFPEPEKKKLKLHTDDIMGIHGTEMMVRSWQWDPHISKTSGKEMVCCRYYGNLTSRPITEYFPVFHGGYAGDMAIKKIYEISKLSGVNISNNEIKYMSNREIINTICEKMNDRSIAKPPKTIEYKKDGKFLKIIGRSWDESER